MDLFNRKKVASLEHELQMLIDEHNAYRNDLIKQADKIDDLNDIISMMDDEILQVAKGRYMNKYIKVQDHNVMKLFRVTDINVVNGMIELLTQQGIAIINNDVNISTSKNTDPDFLAYVSTLSHIKTTCQIIKASEYKKYIQWVEE